MTEQEQPRHDELAKEIARQLAAIAELAGQMHWRPVDTIITPVSSPRNKPVTPKVRYQSHWRKEVIERQLRRG